MTEHMEFGDGIALTAEKSGQKFTVMDIPAMKLVEAYEKLRPGLEKGLDKDTLQKIFTLVFREEAKAAAEVFTVQELSKILKALMPDKADATGEVWPT